QCPRSAGSLNWHIGTNELDRFILKEPPGSRRLDRLDSKALRAVPVLPDTPHSQVGSLDVAAKTPGVEQRMVQPVVLQPPPACAKKVRFPREPYRGRLILRKAAGYQVRKTHGLEQARR